MPSEHLRSAKALAASMRGGLPALLFAVVIFCGCAEGPSAVPETQLREQAGSYLRAALRYPENPAVRAQAVEAATEVLPREEVGLLIREALSDSHHAVRFAACMSLGELRDRDAMPMLRTLAKDPDANVRVAAYFALERLGDSSYRRAWVDALHRHQDATVRRNAALALGRLEDPKAIAVLDRMSREDDDEGVRLQALEAMALLGDPHAISRFVHDAHGGLGYKQPFALLTLGRVKSEEGRGTLRMRLRNSPYLEARLAAARGLGMQNEDAGYDLAIRSLTWNSPARDLPDDPPDNQIARVRSMAALALGDIGRREALGPLSQLMQGSQAPAVQLAAATAILKILR